MDHLPKVNHPYNPIRISCLSSEDYHGGSFHNYDERQGWTSERLENENLRQDAVTFLQTWLYFGTLSEVMGFHVPKSDFIRGADNQKWITTKRLPAYFRRWKDEVASSPQADRKDRHQKSEEIVNFVARKITAPDRTSVASISQMLGPELELSIAVLLFELHNSMVKIYREFRPETNLGYSLLLDNSHTRLLKSRFPGSCPSLVSRLGQRLQVTSMYYASLLSPPSITVNHKRCTENSCVVESLDTSTYLTAHLQSGCSCEHIHVNFVDLFVPILSEMIPLISIEDHGNGLHLKVIPFVDKAETPYVAISHVWSDGLGNPRENSLPECQLRALQQRVVEANSKGQGYFWMDTLCVPRQPPEARKMAIGQMGDIYQQAETVLVLDAELAGSTKECDVEEILMRITRSRWLTRLWTFQEAVKAKRLVFQFLEGPIDVNCFEDIIRQKVGYDEPRRDSVLIEAISFWIAFRVLGGCKTGQLHKFGLLCQQAGWRSTSCAEDEPICLANMLDLDTKRLLETHGSDRMRLFWSLQREIPTAILFEPGQRLQADGFRWAHSSLLNTRLDEDYNLSLSLNTAYVEPQGLITHCPGFFLSLSGKVVNDRVRFKHESEPKWYVMGRDDDMTSDDWMKTIGPDFKSPVLILKNAVRDQVHTDGILTSHQKQESQTVFVRYVCRVILVEEGSYAGRLGIPVLDVQEEGSEAFGKPTASDQRWCIS